MTQNPRQPERIYTNVHRRRLSRLSCWSDISRSLNKDTPASRSCTQQSNSTFVLLTIPSIHYRIAKLPYAPFTGEASLHATYDHCVIQYLNQVWSQNWLDQDGRCRCERQWPLWLPLTQDRWVFEGWIAAQANGLGDHEWIIGSLGYEKNREIIRS